jgi:uncharacterized protein
MLKGKMMENATSTLHKTDLPTRNLPLWQVLLLIFVPTTLLTFTYLLVGHIPAVQQAIPALLLFFLLAIVILFPFELLVVLKASKKEFGAYSLKSAFSSHQKLPWWQIALFGVLGWGFAGLMTVTIAPLEDMLFAPASEWLFSSLPAYFDWTNFAYLQNYSRSTLLIMAVVLVIFNGFVGPIIEELFFRGYLTTKISRFGKFAPLLMTVLFSLYHFWLPFNNIFRIFAFFPSFYLAWKKKNIYIAIVTHVLSNIFSTINIIMMMSSYL